MGIERRTSPDLLRQAWREVFLASHIGWRSVKRTTSTALLVVTGWLTGLLAYAALAGYAPRLAAQSPIQVSADGINTIVWMVVAGLVSLLVGLLKAWVDRTSVQLEAHRDALAKLAERLAHMEGQQERSAD